MPEDERMPDGTYRVRCMQCGKSVSSPLAEPVTVRAWVICPECIQQFGIGGTLYDLRKLRSV
jgi:DNA-directed RNA polymerase subunit RPC12/RpoP